MFNNVAHHETFPVGSMYAISTYIHLIDVYVNIHIPYIDPMDL